MVTPSKLVLAEAPSSKCQTPLTCPFDKSIKLIWGFIISAGWGYALISASGNEFTLTYALPEIDEALHPFSSVSSCILYMPASLVSWT